MKLLISIIFCVHFFQANSQPTETWITKKIDSLVSTKAIPGILVGTLTKGIRHYYSSGFADVLKEQRFDSTTQFEIGSITKTFTSFIVSKILAEKKIADTAYILSYLPDSVQNNLAIAHIQFKQLLNHTSGLPRMPNNMGIQTKFLQPYAGYDINKLYSYLMNVIPKTDGKVDYSNLGAGLAAVLAETISGKPYDKLLKENITVPFGMLHTNLQADINRPISIGYFNGQPAEYWDMQILKGAGGIKSDGIDILNYLEYLLQHKEDNIVQDITTKTASISLRIDIAKAWHMFNFPDKPPIYWHNGGTYGFSSFCAFNKETNSGLFIVINAFDKNIIADGMGIYIMTKILSSK